MVIDSGLEHGSHGLLDVKRMLRVSLLRTDLVLDVAIVEVDRNGFLNVGNAIVFLAVGSNNLEILQPQDLVAVRLLREQDRTADFGGCGLLFGAR
jgi:hypothetical protein